MVPVFDVCEAVGVFKVAEMLALTVVINRVIEGTTALGMGVAEAVGHVDAVAVAPPLGEVLAQVAVAVAEVVLVAVAVGEAVVGAAVVGVLVVGAVVVGDVVGVTVTVTVAVGAVPVGIGTGTAVASFGSGVADWVGFAEVVVVLVRLVCPGALADLPLLDWVRVLLLVAAVVESSLLEVVVVVSVGSVAVAVSETVGETVAVSVLEAVPADVCGWLGLVAP